MAAVIEMVRLHLGVAGPAELREALELGGALEDLHVVDQGFVALGDNGLVLGEREGTEPGATDTCLPASSAPPMGLYLPICKMGGLREAISRGASGARGFEGGATNPKPGRICQKPTKSSRAKGMRIAASHFPIRWGQEGVLV